MKKFIIMGAQGSGKGTQARLIEDDYDLVHISVGDIFRWNIQNHTKLGARVKRIVSSGELVPDEVVEEIVRHRLEQHDWNYGFILDGFPRSRSQAMFFLESYDVDAVILLDVPDAVARDRILSRRLCEQCGLDYNLIYHRPMVAGICDVCGGRLVLRPDDHPDAVEERLKEYHQRVEPILDLFRQKELVVAINAVQSQEEVQAAIRRQIPDLRHSGMERALSAA